MSNQNLPGSDSEADSRSEDHGTEADAMPVRDTAAEYEEQRMRRIKENRERMEAMGLRNMASFLRPCEEKKSTRKLKGKAKLDEEYKPSDDDDDDDEEEDDDEFVNDRPRKTEQVKKRTPKKTPKKVSVQNLMDATEVMDEDEDLKLAIALSLREAKNIETTRSAGEVNMKMKEDTASGKMGDARNPKDNGNRKRKKQLKMASRVQMMEDEVILHFLQFDEAGKGGINIRDLRRMAYAHDFSWSDEEMADMIKYFDRDGDGKLSLDDFRSIVERCNMIRLPEAEASN
ncbi:unnamed protein product [Rhodiola kirilowii]